MFSSSTALEQLTNTSNRLKATIPPENEFAFPATQGSFNCTRGSDAFAQAVNKANLKEPATFKSTTLRKYIATVSQVNKNLLVSNIKYTNSYYMSVHNI